MQADDGNEIVDQLFSDLGALQQLLMFAETLNDPSDANMQLELLSASVLSHFDRNLEEIRDGLFGRRQAASRVILVDYLRETKLRDRLATNDKADAFVEQLEHTYKVDDATAKQDELRAQELETVRQDPRWPLVVATIQRYGDNRVWYRAPRDEDGSDPMLVEVIDKHAEQTALAELTDLQAELSADHDRSLVHQVLLIEAFKLTPDDFEPGCDCDGYTIWEPMGQPHTQLQDLFNYHFNLAKARELTSEQLLDREVQAKAENDHNWAADNYSSIADDRKKMKVIQAAIDERVAGADPRAKEGVTDAFFALAELNKQRSQRRHRNTQVEADLVERIVNDLAADPIVVTRELSPSPGVSARDAATTRLVLTEGIRQHADLQAEVAERAPYLWKSLEASYSSNQLSAGGTLAFP